MNITVPAFHTCKHRHPVDRRGLVVLGGWISDVVGADHKRNVGLRKFGIDVLKLEHLIIGHVGFRQQHVHVAWHAAGDRVDRVLHLDAFLLQHVGHFAQRVLGLRHRHAVARHDDHLGRVLHDEGRIIGRTELCRFLLATGTGGGRLATKNRRG